MKTFFPVLLSFLLFQSLSSQTKLEQDRQAIKAMCGCYEVRFNFSETFQHTKDSTYKPSPDKITGGLEWVQLVEDNPEKIVMQHLLIVGPKDQQQIVKHWRQDWLYQNQDLYVYDGDKQWKYKELPYDEVIGQWTQKVYQVDDSPRYEGSASWVHVDGKHYWEDTTPAPLPRREFSIRDDYNITLRTNRQELTDFGWVHDQDNKKILKTETGKEVVLAEEKGYNTYTKVEDSRCKTAQNWWAKHNDYWADVRAEWQTIFENKQDISMLKSIDDKPLFMHMFELQDQDFTDKKIKKQIKAFIK
ncbi:DUF6607 family protein [Mesohalobacter halotolerans]|uniref:Uncharacterized protein n=1 Tax=Mesohalobacter halotolerans TaxID=1883405 RepID=A0A4U5TT98_9FLAO|nr:DUF6607 family protein [Mesohalobacter halotolerans]MBS3738605.1 hypothetical protein [Psychroflexus sp.]TKS57272.1 hypothetical protein FCN74_02305 [Mesohalobacter halotolerans]